MLGSRGIGPGTVLRPFETGRSTHCRQHNPMACWPLPGRVTSDRRPARAARAQRDTQYFPAWRRCGQYFCASRSSLVVGLQRENKGAGVGDSLSSSKSNNICRQLSEKAHPPCAMGPGSGTWRRMAAWARRLHTYTSVLAYATGINKESALVTKATAPTVTASDMTAELG